MIDLDSIEKREITHDNYLDLAILYGTMDMRKEIEKEHIRCVKNWLNWE